MMESYEEINLDQDPCIFPPCGHFLTMSSMDGRVDLKSTYELNEDGIPTRVKVSQPFDVAQMDKEATCPTCRGSLRSINRYGRLVRRILIDESTKRLVVWSGAVYGDLTERLHKAQKYLANYQSKAPPPLIDNLDISGTRDQQFERVLAVTKPWFKLKNIKQLRLHLTWYANKISKEETPYAKIAALVETSRRKLHRVDTDTASSMPVAQSSFHIMAMALLIRCDICLLAEVLETAQGSQWGSLQAKVLVDLTINRGECLSLISEAQAVNDREREVEFRIFIIQYCAMERKSTFSPSDAEQLKRQGACHAKLAHDICKTYGGKLQSLVPEIKDAERALNDGTFVQTVSSEERRSILKAMAQEFGRGTGHWYVCRNNHPFSVGECGRPMRESVCPQCGERIGGRQHVSVEGVSQAMDLEEELRAMGLGS